MSFGAWPQNRQGGGGGGSRTARNLPKGIFGAYAQYTLQAAFTTHDVDGTDYSGNGHNVSDPGAVIMPSKVPGAAAFMPGCYPGYSTGITNHASAVALALGPDLSIALRFCSPRTLYPTAHDYQCLTIYGNILAASPVQYAAFLNPAGQVGMVWDSALGTVLYFDGPNCCDGLWHQAVFTRTGGTVIDLYVDGAHVSTSPAQGAPLPDVNGLFYIGQNGQNGNVGGAGQWCFGGLDNPCYWQRALTPTEAKRVAAIQGGA